MKKLLCIACVTLLSVSLLVAQTVFATAISSGDQVFTANPGDIIEGVVSGGNTEDMPMTVNIGAFNTFLNDAGARQFVKEDRPRGMYDWITFDQTSGLADPGEFVEFKYTITVPENVAPGTYDAALLVTTSSLNDSDDSEGVGLSVRAASLIYVTIEGDSNESMSLQSFELNNGKFLQGEIVFELTLKNEGDVGIIPQGNIEIFDEKGNKVNEIYPIIKSFEGQEIITGRQNEIPFNLNQKMLPPDETRTYSAQWEKIIAPKGKYTAEATVYYGEDDKKLKAEIPFEIVENLKISQFEAEKPWNSALPVNFLIKLQNTGNQTINPTGYVTINNIFGSQKKRIDLEDADLVLLPGIEATLNGTVWDEGFALGLYTANIHLSYADVDYTMSSSFWVLTWWQAVIVIVVLVLLVFVVYKGIKGYAKMKGKLEKLEHKEKTSE